MALTESHTSKVQSLTLPWGTHASEKLSKAMILPSRCLPSPKRETSILTGTLLAYRSEHGLLAPRLRASNLNEMKHKCQDARGEEPPSTPVHGRLGSFTRHRYTKGYRALGHGREGGKVRELVGTTHPAKGGVVSL